MAEPSKLRARLGVELRATRTMAGLSQRAFATALGDVSRQKWVSRVEAGERLPSRAELEDWLRVSRADEDARGRVAALFEAAHTETRSWESLRRNGHMQDVAAADEEAATLVRSYCTLFVPGMLQVAEYTRQLMPLVDPAGDVAAAVAGRMARQQRLYEPKRRFRYLLAEPVLWWAPGEGVAAAQRDRLVSVASLATVELGVLLARRVGAAGWHDFTLWADDERTFLVTTELLHGGARVVDPDVIAAYEGLWSRLWGAAVRGDDALAVIRSVND